MSSVGVLTKEKKSKCFVKKKCKCPKRNFQSVEGMEKNVSVEFRVKLLGEKKSKCFRVKIKVKRFSLSSYLIVGRYVVKHG
jgi:hypothetical protein